MQDPTREASIAFNVCESGNKFNNNKMHMCASSVAPKFNRLDPRANTHSLAATMLPCIKMENDGGHVLEMERWQPTAVSDPLRLDLNTTKLLLQGSDDPLISHGASNDTHDEDQDYPFKTLLARKTEEQQVVYNGACSTLTKQQLKANLMNARKVQRQPVQTVATQAQRTTRQSKSRKRSSTNGTIKLRFHHQALPAEYAAHYEATQGRPVANSRTVPPVPVVKVKPPPQNQSHENVRSWLKKIAEIQRSAERQQQAQESSKDGQKPRITPMPVPKTQVPPVVEVPSSKRAALKYTDLPYMGEITLDNYKPRRGRKPKKADICHLIYKNYGTIVPAGATTAAQNFPLAEPKVSPAAQPTRLVQRVLAGTSAINLVDEPLNLCLRDQSSDRYSISSGDSDKPLTVTNATTTPTTECGSSSHQATPIAEDHMALRPIPFEFAGKEKTRVAAKLLLRPVSLYYQQLMGVPVETIEKDNQLALKIPIPNGFFANTTPIAAKREPLEPPMTLAKPASMRKRKRSAIFIPPMPAEHSFSPSTEVSICKFKFTGGAKPTLQEKKMLSVDAEGNYRYFNGTGERAMRGYEFISREQQQQSQQPLCSPNSNQDKLYIDIPPPSTDLSLELLQIPSVSPTSSLLLSSSLVPIASHSPSSYSNSHSPMPLTTTHAEDCQKKMEESNLLHQSQPGPNPVDAVGCKRRTTRRSKQREKLEKTFKEKGFLIQTQQLQSAEGATYCKFRQLKKFTRYLFRNWKDHIPESDLEKQQGKVSEVRGQPSDIENKQVEQLGLGVYSLGATHSADNQIV